nr:MAG TPA: hypothetical protein [Caudoviricetes sp.]
MILSASITKSWLVLQQSWLLELLKVIDWRKLSETINYSRPVEMLWLSNKSARGVIV